MQCCAEGGGSWQRQQAALACLGTGSTGSTRRLALQGSPLMSATYLQHGHFDRSGGPVQNDTTSLASPLARPPHPLAARSGSARLRLLLEPLLPFPVEVHDEQRFAAPYRQLGTAPSVARLQAGVLPEKLEGALRDRGNPDDAAQWRNAPPKLVIAPDGCALSAPAWRLQARLSPAGQAWGHQYSHAAALGYSGEKHRNFKLGSDRL